MAFVAIVLLVALIEYVFFGLRVGAARARYGIKAPAVTGHEDFERCFRVHQNTLENLIVFVPALWLFGVYISPLWAAAIGVVFIIGRFMYYVGYTSAAEKRGLGFGIAFLANAALVIGALVGAVRDLM